MQSLKMESKNETNCIKLMAGQQKRFFHACPREIEGKDKKNCKTSLKYFQYHVGGSVDIGIFNTCVNTVK